MRLIINDQNSTTTTTTKGCHENEIRINKDEKKMENISDEDGQEKDRMTEEEEMNASEQRKKYYISEIFISQTRHIIVLGFSLG